MGLIISGSFDKKKRKKKTTVTVLHSDRKEWFLSAYVLESVDFMRSITELLVGVFPFSNSVSDISLEVVLNIYYIWCLVDIRKWFACIIQKLPQWFNIYIFNAADFFHWSLPYFSDIKCIFTMITLSFIILSYYIQTMGKKNGHFSFLCFYFYKCIAYISHLYQMFCSLFSYAFSTFRTQNRKRERKREGRHLDIDWIVARVFVRPAEFFAKVFLSPGR